MASCKLTQKQKDYLFSRLIVGCEQNGIDYDISFNKNNYIKSVKLKYELTEILITDIIILGISILFREEDKITQLWGAKQLINFIKNNKWGE